ncbi:uncharacterized protein KY384_002020 [Bacidia gigantensis]|uniref:uncharacterized protein n=1 Tax=Bacidia gigantensis TaxID=2732470 RepID=UPI001D043B39|nr:uncharacterized protein KY384_002020 [Bacidia gigantensis]KAG8533237.1 hypothetical protein KY384_002020 [Bacidia gigantensis]
MPVPASVTLPEDYQVPADYQVSNGHNGADGTFIQPCTTLLTTIPDFNTSLDERYLVTSPYTTQDHLLDLDTLNCSQRLLAVALASLQCTRPDYATAPYNVSFNWDTVISTLKHSTAHQGHHWQREHFYIVVFRSQVPPSTSRTELGRLDERSHTEANQSGGLLKYWFGVPDGKGRNLATCIWRFQSDARPGSVGAGHKAAARATRDLYTEWHIERLRLVVEAGVNGWSIEEWTD